MPLTHLQQLTDGGRQPFTSFLTTNIPRGYGKFAECIICTTNPTKSESLYDSVKFWKFSLNHETPLNML